MKGYRGYVSSRQFGGERAPQHVQNIVIRHYCEQNNLCYLLSATEYAMEDCYAILNSLISELSELNGIVCYSALQLPKRVDHRLGILREVVDMGKELHFAVETTAIRTPDDISRLEDVFLVRQTCLTALRVEEYRPAVKQIRVNALLSDR